MSIFAAIYAVPLQPCVYVCVCQKLSCVVELYFE